MLFYRELQNRIEEIGNHHSLRRAVQFVAWHGRNSLSLMQNNSFLFAVDRQAGKEDWKKECTGNINYIATWRSLNEQNKTEMITWVFVTQTISGKCLFLFSIFCKKIIKMEEKSLTHTHCSGGKAVERCERGLTGEAIPGCEWKPERLHWNSSILVDKLYPINKHQLSISEPILTGVGKQCQ